MFCKGLAELRKSALPLALATVMVAGTYVALSSTTAAAATAASRALSRAPPPTASGPGSARSANRAPAVPPRSAVWAPKTINIAVFNDASNTIEPGLEAEFPQQATGVRGLVQRLGRHQRAQDRDRQP